MTAQGFTQTVKEFAGAFKSQITAPDNRSFLFKIFLVIAIYVFLILNSLHDLMSPEHVPECVKDKMQDLTLPINEFLENNVFYKRSLIILASGMMDINVFALSVTWMCYEKSYKQFFIILFFYIFRGFLQSVFFLRFPTNYIWSDPGIFSIAVPYFPANDFFFSGHVGLCTVCFIYFTREKMTKMKYFALATIIVEFFTLLVTRAHYFIDLVIGLIVAHYIYLCVDWVYEWRDKWLMEWRTKNKAPEGLELANAEKEKLLDKEKESIKN